MRGRSCVAGAVMALCAAVTYAATLNNPLLQDDNFAVKHNPALHHFSNIPQFFVDPTLFTVRGHGPMYRPALMTVLAVEYAAGEALNPGGHPAAYHVGNIVWHALGALLTAMVLAMLLKTSLASPGPVMAGLIVAVHPFNTFAVNLVNTRSSVMAGVWMLAAVWAYGRAYERADGSERSRVMRWRIGAVLMFALGLLTKSSAIMTPALIVVYEWVCGAREPFGPRLARIARRLAPFLIVAVGYLYLRSVLFEAVFAKQYVRGIGENLAIALATVPITAKLLLWPVGLTLYHQVEPLGRTLAWPLAGGVILLGLGALAVWLRGVVAVALAWAALAWLPYAALPLNVPYAEHRLYVSIAALALGVGVVWARAQPARAWARGVVVVLCLGFVALSTARLHDWSSPVTLFRRAVALHPEASRARVDLGGAYLNRNDNERALAEYRLAARDLNRPEAQHFTGLALLRLGRVQEAEQAARAFIARYGAQDVAGDGHYLLGRALYQQHRYAEAEAAFRTALRKTPRSLNARFALARISLDTGRPAEAMTFLQAILANDPRRPEAQYLLGRAYLAERRFVEAANAFGMVTRLMPNRAEAHYGEGVARAEMGDLTGAQRKFRDALAVNPNFAPARQALEGRQ